MKRTIAIWVAVLLVGIGIGRMLPRVAPDAPTGHGKTANDDRSAAIRSRTGDRNNNPAGNANHPTALSTRMDTEGNEGMILVPSTLLERLSRASGARTLAQDLFGVDDPIQEALGITDREKADIEAAWKGSLGRLRDLEAATLESKEIDEWTVRITVPNQSESMDLLEKGFRTAVHSALGEGRSQAFLAAKQVGAVFSPPAGDRSYTVTTESIGDGQWRYRMTMEDSGGSRVWVGENIPDEIRHLTDRINIQPTLRR